MNQPATPLDLGPGPLENPPPEGQGASAPQSDPFAFGSSPAPGGTQDAILVSQVPLEDTFPYVKALYAGVFLLAVATIYGFYQIFVNDFNPYEAVLNLVLGRSSSDEGGAPKELEAPPPKKEPPAKADSGLRQPVAGNPYWILPNTNLALTNQNPVTGETWSISEEAGIREGLGHQFVYQQYKAVQTMREMRWSGSERQLKQAMGAKKFWTRMFAAVGLAEMGYSITLAELNRLLEGERSELVSGFFERFVDKPNGGQAYVLRQMIRLVDARSRLVVLEGLAKINDPLSGLYLYAATGDINAKVRVKAQRYLQQKKISDESKQQFDRVIAGNLSGREFLKMLGVERSERPMTDPPDSPDEGPVKMITDADIDQELNTMVDEPGEVEVYDFDEEDSDPSGGKKE